jgi:hypothetical protein
LINQCGGLDPKRLPVSYLIGAAPDKLDLTGRYALTHSDTTGELFLSVGDQYNMRQISGVYTSLMRDDILAELVSDNDRLGLRVCCDVGGGLVTGTAKWRNDIVHAESPLIMEPIRFINRTLLSTTTDLDQTPVKVFFQSSSPRYSRIEDWGVIGDYK